MENLVEINLETELDLPTKSTYIDYFDTVNNIIVSRPIPQIDNCHFKIVVSDNPTSDVEKYLKSHTIKTNTNRKNNKKKSLFFRFFLVFK